MKAAYRIRKTPDHLVRMGAAPYNIVYIAGGGVDYFETAEEAREFVAASRCA